MNLILRALPTKIVAGKPVGAALRILVVLFVRGVARTGLAKGERTENQHSLSRIGRCRAHDETTAARPGP
jgi:hypothetical protein